MQPDNLITISEMTDEQLQDFLKSNAMSLKLEEARKIVDLLGRDPSITELHVFNIQWSEHCSYKSSRVFLKTLPTSASNVILGPVEDSGVVELGEIDGERYGVVVSHESHNHPSQVVPYEGAATGVGGIIRDVLCMGSTVFATADPLRFGDPNGKNKNKVKYIANEVINGIAGYGNPVGIPVMSGDVYFNESFDDNCLVNVVCLGILKEKDIIHSYAPKVAEGWDIILVGKATDNSGFGGAAFASVVLDEDEKESNRGAVQVPDPFLKNMLIRSTHAVFKKAREQNVELGFKDLGAGGIMCASAELCADAGFGAEIDLDKVNVAMDLPPYITACSETQERFCWICPPEFTQTILDTYNEEFELPRIAQGAKATVIGTVTKDTSYLLRHKGELISTAPTEVITKGILYEREHDEPKVEAEEPTIPEPSDYNQVALQVLKNPNVASKAAAYKHYDTNVMGNTVITAGEADAGLMAPVPGTLYGVALKADCNPRYNRIDPYLGAVNAVAESMRNVAAVGAIPRALTDCLNYGNPEDKESFGQFVQGVKGIKDAAENIKQKGTDECVPIVSGNVSFYNHSVSGKSVDPSPVVACVGIMKDSSKAITMKVKHEGSSLILIGDRKDELGGSVYYEVFGQLGKNVPHINFEQERNSIYAVIDAIDQGLITACHDVSDGGLFVTLAEMIMGGSADGSIGMNIELNTDLAFSKALFSESSGFVMEVKEGKEEELNKLLASHNITPISLGKTQGDKLNIQQGDGKLSLTLHEMKQAWTTGFSEALR